MCNTTGYGRSSNACSCFLRFLSFLQVFTYDSQRGEINKTDFFARVLYMLIWNILRYFLKSALLSQIFEAGIAGRKK